MNSATWKLCSIHQCGGHTLGLDPVKNRLARQNKKNRMEVLFTLISTLEFYPILNCWNFLARDIEHAQWLTLEEGFMFVKYFLKIGRIKGDCGFQLFSFFFSFFSSRFEAFFGRDVIRYNKLINDLPFGRVEIKPGLSIGSVPNCLLSTKRWAERGCALSCETF